MAGDTPRVAKLGRRELMKALGAGAVISGSGLALGVWWRRRPVELPEREQAFAPSAFLAIGEDDVVTIWCTKSEMGQGVRTALPMIVADELDAEWARVRVEQAGAHPAYGDQTTVASASVASMYEGLRVAGASARAMLVEAAARGWGVEPDACTAADGEVLHEPSGRRARYGALARLAASLDVPSSPRLKSAHEHRLIGTGTLRTDTPEKLDGSAQFGADVRVDGMVYASVARPPAPGARLVGYDERAARAVTGAIDVVRVEALRMEPSVAVIAETTWAAFRGRDALEARWDMPRAEVTSGHATATVSSSHATATVSSSRQAMERLRAIVERDGVVAEDHGDARERIAHAHRRVEATYEVPLLAHAPMEPLVATAHVERDRCTIWAPTQNPELCRREAADALGIELERVTVHVTFLGGGFGRRAERDEVREAVALSRSTGRPVKVQWSREDDLRADWYRPPAVMKWTAGLDPRGDVLGVHARIASPGLTGVDGSDGALDPLACDGAIESAYAWPASRVEWRGLTMPVRLGIWRSVGHSYNAFAVESFVDELAAAAGRDPVSMRRALLPSASRARAVLDRAVSRAGWGEALAAGRGRGVAVHACFGSFVSMVAEVSVVGDRARVHRVVCAIDCGRVINPNIVRQQLEGGVAFGLSAALHGEIELEDGRVVQSNFHDHPILRIDEMPEVVVEIVASEAAPSGVGELGVPAIAPAVANAIAALGRARPRSLPMRVPFGG